VLKQYARIAFANPRRLTRWGPEGLALLPSDGLSEDDAAAVAWVSTGGHKGKHAQRIRMHDKQRALDALARHLGLLKDGRATYDLRPFAERQNLADGTREKLRQMIDKLAPKP
jgi:hypothetical protein